MPEHYHYGSRRRKVLRRRRIIGAVIALLVAVLGFVILRFVVPALQKEDPLPDAELNAPVQQPVSPDDTAKDPDEAPAVYLPTEVPESREVSTAWLDDALIIGDSRAQGLIMYNNLSNCTSFATKGLSVVYYETTEVSVPGLGSGTIPKMLEKIDCSRVYIKLGMNDLGLPYESTFGEKYSELIDLVQQKLPEAEIYIHSVLPLTKAKEAKQPDTFSMKRVNAYNEQLKTLAAEQGVYYLGVPAFCLDAEGYLPDEAASDGVHLTSLYCKEWLHHILTHVVLPEDYDGEFDVNTSTGGYTPTKDATDPTDFTK